MNREGRILKRWQVLLLVLIIAGLIFDINYRLIKNADYEIRQSLEYTAEYDIQRVCHAITSKYDQLMLIGAFSVQNGEISVYDNSLYENSELKKITVYKKDGKGYSAGELLGNFKNETFFQESMQNQKNVYYDYSTQNFVFSVPIQKDNEVIGAVSGQYSTLDLYNELCQEKPLMLVDSSGKRLLNSPVYDEHRTHVSISSDDITKFKEEIKDKEEAIGSLTIEGVPYRIKSTQLGMNQWSIISIIQNNQFGTNGILWANLQFLCKVFVVLFLCMWYIKTVMRKNSSRMREANRKMEALADSIPGGAVECELDQDITIKFATDAFLQMIHCTAEEFEAGMCNKLLYIIYSGDLEEFKNLYDTHFKEKQPFCYTLRIVDRNNQIIWVKGRSAFVQDAEGVWKLYTVCIDISAQKALEKEIENTEERYRIVLEQSKSVIFEYNLKEQQYFITSNAVQILGDTKSDIFSVLVAQQKIHPNDEAQFEAMMEQAYKKAGYYEIEIRILTSDEKYSWYVLCLTAIADESAVPVRIVGNVTDIDAQKRTTQTLIAKTQMDALTNCYNRDTSVRLIKHFLESNTEIITCALAIVDIDYFKKVNDTFGHIEGDEILKKTGEQLRSQVRSSDIVGRLGGDEFVIFMKFTSSIIQIKSRMQAIISAVNQINIGDEDRQELGVSVGVAIYPDDGTQYEELADKADKALYLSKSKGRNCFTLYNDKNLK